MTIKRISKIQPPNFEFTEINMIEAQKEITKYNIEEIITLPASFT